MHPGVVAEKSEGYLSCKRISEVSWGLNPTLKPSEPQGLEEEHLAVTISKDSVLLEEEGIC